MANNTDQVAVGAAGIVYVAPKGTAAPTDASTALASAWNELGIISEDGITIAEESDTTDINGWAPTGVVRTVKTSYKETIAFTPIEVNSNVLQQMYGEDNVSVSSTGKIIAKHTGADLAEVCLCIDVVHSSKVKGRYFAAAAQLTEKGDLELAGSDAAGRELTYTCNPDTNGVTITEFEDITTA
jgi:hypothetical protein